VNVLDKRQILPSVSAGEKSELVLELGCGDAKRVPEAIGIDSQNHDCVDIVGDVFDVLRLVPSESVDVIYSFHFFEHIPDLEGLLDEVARVLKKGGKCEIVVPHFSSPYFYSDYTHRTFFGLYSMSYFALDLLLSRKVPTYGKVISYELVDVNLLFKSPKPFYFRYGFKRFIGALFNLNGYMKELYEENFCYLFPCYEIGYSLKKLN
jgi:ubiquinone/menaquinone biosynthesis C-methylase UbiE